MRNIVLGIVGVCCLQLSFQLYMGVERTDAEYARIPSLGGLPASDQTIADIPDTGYTFDELDGVSRPVRTIAVRPRVRHIQNQGATFSQALAKRPVTHLFVPSTTVIVAKSYPPALLHRTEYPRTNSSTSVAKTLAAREESRPEQKSLIAKALPVIKKPYDWIKSVGSLFK